MPKSACAIVVKNAGHKFAEWLAYQFVLGFDAVLVLDNGSTDDTREIARAFLPRFDVRVAGWDRTDPAYQRAGYDHLVGAAKGEFDWVACIDSDEFIVLPEGRSLHDLLDVPAGTAGISMPWAMFGSSGLDDSPQDLVIRSFLHRAPEAFGPNKHIKSMVRPARYLSCGNVHFFEIDGAYVDMTHAAVTVKSALQENVPDYAAGRLHHYFVQSKRDWADKLARGYHDCQRNPDEFFYYDRNEVFDDSALRYAAGVEDILRTLFGASAGRPMAGHGA